MIHWDFFHLQVWSVRFEAVFRCIYFFLKKFLEDISPFRGATDTLFWTSGDISPGFQSQGGYPFCMLSRLCDPQIHLWCDTCWLYRDQNGSKAFLIHLPADIHVCKHWWRFGVQTHECPCRTLQARHHIPLGHSGWVLRCIFYIQECLVWFQKTVCTFEKAITANVVMLKIYLISGG